MLFSNCPYSTFPDVVCYCFNCPYVVISEQYCPYATSGSTIEFCYSEDTIWEDRLKRELAKSYGGMSAPLSPAKNDPSRGIYPRSIPRKPVAVARRNLRHTLPCREREDARQI